jgi:hypothetical protein
VLLELLAIGLQIANRAPDPSGRDTSRSIEPETPPAVAVPRNTAPPARKAASADPERDLAEWVVGLDGTGTVVLETGGRRAFGPDEPVPRGKFVVTALAVPPRAADRWHGSDLERFRGRVRLTTVRLEHPNALTDAHLGSLAAPGLKGLALHGTAVRVTGEFLSRFAELESLSLVSAPDFADADLAAVGKLPRLGSLALNAPRITPAGMRGLRNPLLKTVTFGPDLVLTAEHVRPLQGLPLEAFESEAVITDDAFLELAVVPTLKRIRLRRTTLTDAGLKAVLGFGLLEEFRAVESAITGTGLEVLAEHRALRALDLTGSKVTDESLAKLLNLPGLRELRLAACPVTDEGAVFLAQLDRLEILDLSDTAITDATLGMLKRHQTLRHLAVKNTQVTPPAVRDFERGTPDCRVEWGPRRK